MPLYEYECDDCGHRFEKIQKFSDPLEDTCPKCGGPVHKLMSSPAIQFKGSGFYITDYPKGDKGSAPKSDGGKKAAAEKADASPTAEKSDKGGSSSDSASTTGSTPAASSTASAAAAAPSPSSSPSTKD
jgi:putative FmdB family regulatory protein